MIEPQPETPQLTRARNSGHQPLNDLIRDDWRRLVEQHPDAFDVLIYVPKSIVATEEEADGVALFGTVDRHQGAISYDLPVVASALEASQDDPMFSAMWDDPENMGTGASDTLTLLLSVCLAPLGAIVEFEEEQANGQNRRVWWYVHSVEAVGTAAVGGLHHCIPCGDLESAQQAAAEVINASGGEA